VKCLLLFLCLTFQDKTTEDLIDKLRSDDVRVRDEAARALRVLGMRALPDLERSIGDNDKEVAQRIKELLRGIKGEDAFQQIRESLQKAKSVSIQMKTTSKTHIGGALNEESGSITLLMKQENKVYFNARVLGLNSHLVSTLVSNGRRLWVKWPEAEWKEYDTPRDLNLRLSSIVSETGCFSPMYVTFLIFEAARIQEYASPLKILKLTYSESDKESPSVAYTLRDENGTRDMTHWFNPATHALIRVQSGSQNPKVRSSAEVVSQRWQLDAEIPDERFAQPVAGKTEEDFIDQAKKMALALRDNIESYSDDVGTYPTSEQGLEALFEKPKKNPIPKDWKGPYMKGASPLKDPWGNSFVYRFPARQNPRNFEVFSKGPDGIPDTDDDLR